MSYFSASYAFVWGPKFEKQINRTTGTGTSVEIPFKFILVVKNLVEISRGFEVFLKFEPINLY